MYRQADGKNVKIHWALDVLAQIKEIEYSYKNFEEANNANKKIISEKDRLFDLNEENFNKICENTLYPAYYLINYGSDEIYTDAIDSIKFGDAIIDVDTLEFNIDLQLYNNIIFMVGNSNHMTTFNGNRNVWSKIIQAYDILADNDYKRLRRILISRYSYNDEQIEKYCKDLENYLYYFYENKIMENMNPEKCYECFRFFKSLWQTSIPKKVYADLNDKFNDFLLELLNDKINEMYNSGYCYDLFENDFFANEILALSDLNARKKEAVVENLLNCYKACIEVRINHAAYYEAKKCYDIVTTKQKEIFSYFQLKELQEFKEIIDNNYKKDSAYKNETKFERNEKTNNKVIPIFLLAALIGIISLIGCLITVFHNIVWIVLLITCVIIVAICLLILKHTL